MAVGFKTGGRKKGTINKKSSIILETCKRFNFDPAVALITLLREGIISDKDKCDVILRLMEFTHAKRKPAGDQQDEIDVTPEFMGLLNGSQDSD